jgi:hypothetical protein
VPLPLFKEKYVAMLPLITTLIQPTIWFLLIIWYALICPTNWFY